MNKMTKHKMLIVLAMAITGLALIVAPAYATHKPNHGGPQPGVAGKLVVATSGGDFTSITEAFNSITPDANNPFVIEVMPGTYTENVVMKSYVHLKGSGREVTTIQGLNTSQNIIDIFNLTNVEVSGFKITSGLNAIQNENSSSVIIRDNEIVGFNGSGIRNVTSSGLIAENEISIGQAGIFNDRSSPAIRGNSITGIIGNAIVNEGLLGVGSSPLITGNSITGNNGYGISNSNDSSPRILHNVITGNGDIETDIGVLDASSVPLISFNVYDDITGTSGVGDFNINSNGAPAPAP